MGLSAPRRRAKLAHDPNNSHWTQSSSKYGQRILESQGWKNGDAIGHQRNSATTPQSVFSRLSIKDGNLGLGARNIRGVDEEPTGLADFQDLLGRLNGKSEVSIQRTQKAREEMTRHRYLERRGTISFVKGGYMEPEKLSKLMTPETTKPEIASVKDSLRNESQCKTAQESIRLNGTPKTDLDILEAQSKAAKKHRKEERRQRKKLKQLASREQAEATTVEVKMKALEPTTATVTTPAHPPQNRNLVRQRYIRQKQLAMSDVKALNEILMIKS